MKLNKQGPKKIDWTDYTWNPISGYCKHGCSYCYMRNMWGRFPELKENKLREKTLNSKFPKNPSKIFVGSSTDMFGNWVSKVWIARVLEKVKNSQDHTFQLLTKNPLRYGKFWIPNNAWVGTTIDGTEKTSLNMINLVECTDINIKYVSFEPLLFDIKITEDFKKYFSYLDWIIIGADSSKGAEKPKMFKADKLIRLARLYDIPVWVKDNYNYPKIIKEFPEKL